MTQATVLEYRVVRAAEIDDPIRITFAEMLRKQGKVGGDLGRKADRCQLLCIAKLDSTVVAIGGIKPKTDADFDNDKARVPELSSAFEWELGYLYTEPNCSGRGIASSVVRLLIDAYGKGNLMASTEISANPAMVRILEKQGFRLFGHPWKSGIHGKHLGLFLRFE
jgi:hypothetical protein